MPARLHGRAGAGARGLHALRARPCAAACARVSALATAVHSLPSGLSRVRTATGSRARFLAGAR
eukprot:13582631-Alexandrium_andersonii.AAC.1